MSPRGVVALATLLLVTGLALSIAGEGLEAFAFFGIAIVAAFGVIGVLIASRHPRNPIGWIFCGVALTGSLMLLTGGVVEVWLEDGGVPTALGEAAAVYGDASWILVILPAATFLLLLFPDGRLPSPRWRPVAWCAGAGIALLLVGEILGPGPLEDYPEIVNPYGVDGPVPDVLAAIAALTLAVAIVGSPLSLIIRFRRAGREQRQQIKWLALAGAVAAVTFVLALATYDVLPAGVPDGAIMLSILMLPVAAGMAILRYRLYDIDVVINRTLVYGALTATLGVAYLAMRAAPAAGPEPADGGVRPRNRRLDAGGGGALPPGAGADPARR